MRQAMRSLMQTRATKESTVPATPRGDDPKTGAQRSRRRSGPQRLISRVMLVRLTSVLVLAPLMLPACAQLPENQNLLAIRDEGPLGGEALLQRKHDLDRAYRDMAHFQTTMQSLIDRQDSKSLAALDRFVEAYMGTHLAPLLASEWQSGHPELMARDASLRFMQAEILIQMRYPRQVQAVRDEIERRYQGQYELLIEDPIGKQGTLGRGLEILKDRKWKG